MLRPLLFAAFLLCSTAATAQTDSFVLRTESTELAGHDQRVDIYLPSIDPTGEVAVIAHGFTRTRVRHRDLAVALTEVGITAVVPDLPFVLDHWGNGNAIVELVHKLETGAFGLPPAVRSRLVLVGTSAGGLATVLAAAKLPGLAGWVGLDPTDRTGTGVNAAAHLTSPAVVLLAEPSTCNLLGSGRAIARAIPGLLRHSLLQGASHCDFEGPTTKLCRVVCGESSPEMRELARTVTVSAVVELLRARGIERRSSNEPAE